MLRHPSLSLIERLIPSEGQQQGASPPPPLLLYIFSLDIFDLEDALRYALLGIGLGHGEQFGILARVGFLFFGGRWSEVGIFFTFLVDLANKKMHYSFIVS